MTALAYRHATDADLPLIVNSFLDSYRTSRAAGLICMDDWSRVMGEQFRKVLARPGVDVWVAYHPGETDHTADLYGWLAVERDYLLPANQLRSGRRTREMVKADVPLLHYVYVKQPYRRLGVAKGLLRAAGIGERWNYTCRTSVVAELADKIPHARWTHLVARFEKR